MSKMLDRFQGDAGKELRLETFFSQSIVARDAKLAEELADLVELRELQAGEILIEQNEEDDDIFFIISGSSVYTSTGAALGLADVAITSVRWQPSNRRSVALPP
ncbi:hypothetical protein ACC671_22095 [Rhizobium ruizarguesonis]|uniref:hypothetical protein n=1 Tax=Rhizobium leguminosarum TaxID=384 RepID=UPI001C90C1F2|nr:hypothetical protein [Rhizobium leguminosarum]MBY3043174.1 hypothetical protein [Rhizobium leguminosarum]